MKKIISIFIVIVFLISSAIPSFAIEKETINDTLSKSQDEYLATTKSTRSVLDNNEEKTVRAVCESFLTICRASVRRNDYYPQVLIDEKCIKSDEIQYRLSEYNRLANIHSDSDKKIIWDKISFPSFSCLINNNVAEVSIVEDYTYFYNDGFDGLNYRVREYYITLQKNDGSWEIINITTNDPWEKDNNYEDTLNQDSFSNINITDNILNDDIAEPNLTMYTWTYDTAVAAEYAIQHRTAATNNSNFPYLPKNCQNFASQCVWAGLIGDINVANTRNRDGIPAVSTARAGSGATNVWRYGDAGGAYEDTWISCNKFIKMLVASSSNKEGPYGTVTYGNISNTAKGNIIYWTDNGETAAVDRMKHAMFVVDVTGSAGSRTKDNIKIAAHTTDTNTAYVTLEIYDDGNRSASEFAVAKIMRGYYRVPSSSEILSIDQDLIN